MRAPALRALGFLSASARRAEASSGDNRVGVPAGSGGWGRAVVVGTGVFGGWGGLLGGGARVAGAAAGGGGGCFRAGAGWGQLVFESLRGGGRRARAFPSDGGEMFGCEPLAALDRWRRGGASAPLELLGAWRGEHARLVWIQEMGG